MIASPCVAQLFEVVPDQKRAAAVTKVVDFSGSELFAAQAAF
jgi:hypothetical protein